MLEQENWFSQDEGELSLDVFRDGDDLVIRSLLAGVTQDDLDISLHDDLLTIRGDRKSTRTIQEKDWVTQECYWGAFSRSLVLPFDVDSEHVNASMENGILEIRIPIQKQKKSVQVRFVEGR
ncbi:MAG: Hsp20/alpha crystallin family protein [bacterium]|nr:Hsp20/alpha crystallin family protein [bacterium]